MRADLRGRPRRGERHRASTPSCGREREPLRPAERREGASRRPFLRGHRPGAVCPSFGLVRLRRSHFASSVWPQHRRFRGGGERCALEDFVGVAAPPSPAIAARFGAH